MGDVQIVDGRWRPLDAARIEWELDGGRPVRVVTETDLSAGPTGAVPHVEVQIFEDDERGERFAVVVMPANGPAGGMRSGNLPAFREVLRIAEGIADEANARLEALDR